jgi:hypothetical protein
MKLACSIAFLILLSCCAPSRYVKPLAKNQKAIAFSFGGPLINFSGAPIPIPFSTLGYGHGLTDNVTVYGNLHTTSLLFGNAQADLGTTLHLYKKENRYGISASPGIQLAYNLRNQTGFRIWPSADINAYLHIAQKPSYLYAGANSWVELSRLKAHKETHTRHLIPNMQLGYCLVKTKWLHQFEFKYLGIGIPNLPGVVDYIGISGQGSLGIYYSVIRKF